ncbi:hypothetical protein Tco_0818764 [Tanacetum coccineum]
MSGFGFVEFGIWMVRNWGGICVGIVREGIFEILDGLGWVFGMGVLFGSFGFYGWRDMGNGDGCGLGIGMDYYSGPGEFLDWRTGLGFLDMSGFGMGSLFIFGLCGLDGRLDYFGVEEREWMDFYLGDFRFLSSWNEELVVVGSLEVAYLVWLIAIFMEYWLWIGREDYGDVGFGFVEEGVLVGFSLFMAFGIYIGLGCGIFGFLGAFIGDGGIGILIGIGIWNGIGFIVGLRHFGSDWVLVEGGKSFLGWALVMDGSEKVDLGGLEVMWNGFDECGGRIGILDVVLSRNGIVGNTRKNLDWIFGWCWLDDGLVLDGMEGYLFGYLGWIYDNGWLYGGILLLGFWFRLRAFPIFIGPFALLLFLL